MNRPQNKNRIICLIGILVALFGLALTANEGVLGQCMQHADKRPAVIAWPLGLLALTLLLVSGFAYPVGTGVLCYRLSAVLGRPPLSLPMGLSLPVSANVFMALQALPFLSLPAGTRIRPMAWAVMMFLLGIAVLVLGIVAAVRTIKKERRTVAGIAGILLSLTPIVVGVLSLHLVCSLRGLEMAE